MYDYDMMMGRLCAHERKQAGLGWTFPSPFCCRVFPSWSLGDFQCRWWCLWQRQRLARGSADFSRAWWGVWLFFADVKASKHAKACKTGTSCGSSTGICVIFWYPFPICSCSNSKTSHKSWNQPAVQSQQAFLEASAISFGMAMGSVGEHHWPGAFQVLRELKGSGEPNQPHGERARCCSNVVTRGTKLQGWSSRHGEVNPNTDFFPLFLGDPWGLSWAKPLPAARCMVCGD